jgi:hypothetical protein
MALLLWGAIQDSKMAGAEEFDLGRSEIENKGLIAFKDHWANRHTQMAYWRYPALESLSVREDWKLRMVKHAFAHMPDKLLTVMGRLIYRHIG